jgi:hypothetical protein
MAAAFFNAEKRLLASFSGINPFIPVFLNVPVQSELVSGCFFGLGLYPKMCDFSFVSSNSNLDMIAHLLENIISKIRLFALFEYVLLVFYLHRILCTKPKQVCRQHKAYNICLFRLPFRTIHILPY